MHLRDTISTKITPEIPPFYGAGPKQNKCLRSLPKKMHSNYRSIYTNASWMRLNFGKLTTHRVGVETEPGMRNRVVLVYSFSGACWTGPVDTKTLTLLSYFSSEEEVIVHL